LTVSYISNTNRTVGNDETLTISYDGINGITYVGKDNLLIDTESIVTVNPTMIKIDPQQTRNMTMKIAIPEAWYDETVGADIFLSPSFRIVSNPPAIENIGLYAEGISVHVTD